MRDAAADHGVFLWPPPHRRRSRRSARCLCVVRDERVGCVLGKTNYILPCGNVLRQLHFLALLFNALPSPCGRCGGRVVLCVCLLVVKPFYICLKMIGSQARQAKPGVPSRATGLTVQVRKRAMCLRHLLSVPPPLPHCSHVGGGGGQRCRVSVVDA